MRFSSLRARLTAIILAPLLVVAVLAAIWQFRVTSDRAADIFDRGLLSAALAISRDVAISGGDALSPATRRLVSDTSGGELFYHVYAPDGVFVTGYATPPAPPGQTKPENTEPVYYDAIYQGRAVRVLRYQDATTIDGVTGLFTISVWQDMVVRTTFVDEVVARTIGMIGFFLVSVALIVWFGVRFGLQPLLDLQTAIAKRTPTDLTPIRRTVPVEARGIVSTLNDLLDRVSRRISSKDEFISNAAHQLRNPIAGVLALAESVENAPSPESARQRSSELVTAARDAAHLANQLLSFERANGSDTQETAEELDLVQLCQGLLARFQTKASASLATVTVSASLPEEPLFIRGDRVMLEEAVLNLLQNALTHGGPNLSKVDLSLRRKGPFAEICVQDDGVGLAESDYGVATARFSQVRAGTGSGLGLPIAKRVAENHGGQLRFIPGEPGLSIVLTLALHMTSSAPVTPSDL